MTENKQNIMTQDSVIKEYVHYIISILNKHKPLEISYIEHLRKIPIYYLDEIMNTIIDLSTKNVKDPHVPYLALHTFFTPRTRVIRMNNFPHMYIHKSLEILVKRCCDVEVLDLRGFDMMSDDEDFYKKCKSLFTDLLKKLQVLKELHLDKQIVPLYMIIECCPVINHLTSDEIHMARDCLIKSPTLFL